MHDLDLAAKALLRIAPVTFARLALGPSVRVRAARAEDVEAPALARRVDKCLSVKVEGRRDRVRVHLEVAASWTSACGRRQYEYYTLLRRDGSDVESLLLCLKPGRKQGRPAGRYVEGTGRTQVWFEFPVVCLWKLRARDVERLGEALVPFLPFARDATPEAVERAMRRLTQVTDMEARADLQGALALCAGKVFPGVDWRARIPTEVVVKNTFVESFKRDGRLEERRVIAAQLLRVRLGGATSRRYVKRLKQATPRTLVTIIRIVGAGTLVGDALRARLDRLLPE